MNHDAKLRNLRSGTLEHIDRIVPNPPGDVVRVQGIGLRVEGLEVYDVMGRRVIVPVSTTPQPSSPIGSRKGSLSEEGELELDVRALPEGVYYVRAGQASARFEIIR